MKTPSCVRSVFSVLTALNTRVNRDIFHDAGWKEIVVEGFQGKCTTYPASLKNQPEEPNLLTSPFNTDLSSLWPSSFTKLCQSEQSDAPMNQRIQFFIHGCPCTLFSEYLSPVCAFSPFVQCRTNAFLQLSLFLICPNISYM